MREVLGDGQTVTVREALKAFGWTCGPEFEKRYYSDAWVFNLANAVQRLTEENRRLTEQTGRFGHDPLTCQDGHLGCEIARDEQLDRGQK